MNYELGKIRTAHVCDEESTMLILASILAPGLIEAYPSGFARISSVMEERSPRLLFLKVGRYGLETSK